MSDGSKSTFRVMFKEPIEVQANTGYTACATLKVRSVIDSKLTNQYLHTLWVWLTITVLNAVRIIYAFNLGLVC